MQVKPTIAYEPRLPSGDVDFRVSGVKRLHQELVANA